MRQPSHLDDGLVSVECSCVLAERRKPRMTCRDKVETGTGWHGARAGGRVLE